MTKPNMQHYVPRVYLKQFQIDNLDNKSFVYCINFRDLYKRKILKLGINDKVFKLKKFYNDDRLNDPYIIEKMLASDIEPKYDKIISAIKNGPNLSSEIREDLLQWLFTTQNRARFFRDNVEETMRWIIEMQNKLGEHELKIDDHNLIDKYVKRNAKEIHLDLFSDRKIVEKSLKTFIDTLVVKHWKILKSRPESQFMTNDNPGFSPNMNERLSLHRPFHSLMELNRESIIYFVLSPDYCLEIRPFFAGTPVEVNFHNMAIECESISDDYISFINWGVLKTCYGLVISNQKEIIKKAMAKELKWKHGES